MPGPTPCTRCGAPLPETEGARVCALCGQFHGATSSGSRPRFGAGAAPGPTAEPPGGRSPPPGRPARAQTSPRARAKGTGVVGCVIVLTTVVPVVVVLAAVILALRSATTGSDQSIDGVVETDLSPTTGDLLVLPGDLDDDPAVVTMAIPIGGDGDNVVALVELEDGPVWQAEVVPEDVYSAQFAATDDVVLASLGRKVVALERDTGDVRWEGEASDDVHPFCTTCFVVVDDTLVVLGGDGEVTAFALDTGDVVWEHRFTSPSGRVVPLGDAVLLVDDGPEDDVTAAVSMVLVRPSDGSELSRFAPGCVDPSAGTDRSLSASPTLPVIPVPGTDDVVVAYGTFPSCVQRWTVTTGEQRWSRTTDARLDWYDADDRAWAVGPSELVIAGYEEWLVVNLAEGGILPVPVPADSLADPAVTISGDLFVGTVSSTRGSAEWSLVAHSLRSGEERWTRELGPDQTPAIVGPESSTQTVYDGSLFAVLPVGDELRLLTAGPPGPRFEVSGIDPDTGEGETVGVAPIRTDSPTTVSARIDTVRDGLALVDAGGVLQVVDLTSGEVHAAWGR